jgi:hypothetical protein
LIASNNAVRPCGLTTCVNAVRSTAASLVNGSRAGRAGHRSSLKAIANKSLPGWLAAANAVAPAISLSVIAHMLTLLSMISPTVTGASSSANKVMAWGLPSS